MDPEGEEYLADVGDERFRLELAHPNSLAADEKKSSRGCGTASFSGSEIDKRSVSLIVAGGRDLKGENKKRINQSGESNEVRDLRSALTKSREESEKLGRQLVVMQQKLDAELYNRKLAEQKLSVAENVVATQKKEMVLLQRSAQLSPGDAKDRKLENALREIALLRSKVDEMNETKSISQGEGFAQLRASVSKLSSEKNELINCLRKQNKLIDVLKRQKVHLEAAVLVELAEKEVERYFDLAR
ncbi:hypothetical protein DQ04_03381100 [Trypanosoma grayi]|uniref:hypothetical protein n=1 Tax=Trypanosoma grayi TaxID=71804 RepID=UPI0004F434AC|nr:hypothetical protein DQ04_03381100 [Trypanosoma grayi]KEG10718.1 hypothetical protein DQ04_03381100 [Trypanosoma grayi]